MMAMNSVEICEGMTPEMARRYDLLMEYEVCTPETLELANRFEFDWFKIFDEAVNCFTDYVDFEGWEEEFVSYHSGIRFE